MNVSDLANMFLGHILHQEEEQDFILTTTSWGVAHIMNSSGQLKRPVKPKDLYVPLAIKNKVETKTTNEEKEELLKRFNL